MRRLTCTALTALTLSVGMALAAGPASAAVCAAGQTPASTYPSCTEGISDTTVVPGEIVTVSTAGEIFVPGETVEYGVRSTYIRIGATTATAVGSASATFAMPNLSVGPHEVLFTSVASGRQASVPFTVVATSTGTGSGSGSGSGSGTNGTGTSATGVLPRTGSAELVPITAAGIGLVLVGGAVVFVARRRHEDSPTSPA